MTLFEIIIIVGMIACFGLAILGAVGGIER